MCAGSREMSNGEMRLRGRECSVYIRHQQEPTVTVPAPLLLVRRGLHVPLGPRQDRPPKMCPTAALTSQPGKPSVVTSTNSPLNLQGGAVSYRCLTT